MFFFGGNLSTIFRPRYQMEVSAEVLDFVYQSHADRFSESYGRTSRAVATWPVAAGGHVSHESFTLFDRLICWELQ